MILGNARPLGSGGPGGGAGVSAQLTATPLGNGTSVRCDLVVPSGDLSSWDLEMRPASGAWSTVEATIVDPTYTVGDLDSETAYEFRATVRVASEVVATASATTLEPPPGPSIPAATPSLWIGVGLTSVGNTLTDIRSYRAIIRNTTQETWTGLAPLFQGVVNAPGQILGFRVANNSGGGFQNGTIKGTQAYTPPPGIWSSSNRWFGIGDVAPLPVPVPPGGQAIIETVLAAGPHSAGSVSIAAYGAIVAMSSRSAAGQNVMAGDTPTWTSGFSQPWTHIYITTAGDGIRKVGFGSDSLGGQIIPVADAPNQRREGYAAVGNQLAVANGDKFCLVPLGQGGATPADAAIFLPNLIAEVGDKLDLILPQGVSYNGTPTSTPAVDAVIANVQTVHDAAAAAGLRFGVVFHSPPGSARNTPTYLPYWQAIVAHWKSVMPTRVVDIAPYVADPVDPTIIDPPKSIDGIHIGAAGSASAGQGAYEETKEMLVAEGEIEE